MGLRPLLNQRVKKSAFLEMIIVIVVLLGISLFLLVINKVWSDIETPLNEGLSGAMPNNTDANVTKILGQTGSTTLALDSLLPFLIIGLIAFVMISAGAYLGHPIMIFVGFIVMGIVIMVSVIYSNLYKSISETTEFSATSSSLTISGLFMRYLPYVAFLIAIIVVITIIWSKKGGATGGY